MEPKEGQSRPSNNKWWVMALIMNVSVPQEKLAYAKTDVYAIHSIQSNRDLSGNNKSLYCLKKTKKNNILIQYQIPGPGNLSPEIFICYIPVPHTLHCYRNTFLLKLNNNR